MAKELLDGADVRAVFEERGGEGVPERVGGDVLEDTSFDRSATDHGGDEKPREADVFDIDRVDVFGLVIMSDKEGSEVIGSCLQIAENCLFCPVGEEDRPHLGTLSADDEFGDFGIDARSVEAREL